MLFATVTLFLSSSVTPLTESLTPPAWPAGMKSERLADGGVRLNDVAARAIHEHLEWGERIPALTVVLIDSNVKEALEVQAEDHRVDMAQQAAKVDKLERNQRTPLTTLRDIGIGAGIAAIVIGILEARK